MKIIFHPKFRDELENFDETLQKSFAAYLDLLKTYGVKLERPYVATLKSRVFKNLKELRITTVTGEWRISFAFDPNRNAVILFGASKSGVTQKLFYDKLISLSEKRFREHLEGIK